MFTKTTGSATKTQSLEAAQSSLVCCLVPCDLGGEANGRPIDASTEELCDTETCCSRW
jgi:hypothetical protein